MVLRTVHPVDRLHPLENDGPVGKLDDPRGWTITLDNGGHHDIAVSLVDAARID